MASKKWFGWIASMIIVAMAIAGCTPTTKETPTSEGGGAEEVVVQYWSNGWFPSSIGARTALIEKFNEEYKGRIQVEYVQGDGSQGETYVQSGAAAGGGIACVMDWYGAIDWYRKGWVMDLSPYMTDEIRAYMDESQWEARSFEGAVTSNGTVAEEPSLMLLYNPTQFEAAGIEPATVEKPWTWAELYENAKLMTLDANGKHLGEDGFDSTNVVQWGYVVRLESEKAWQNGMLFAQGRMGKAIVREENGEWGWYLDEDGAEVYKMFLSPVSEGITPPEAIGLGGDTLHQMFADEKASIILRESFAIPIIHDNYPDFEFAAMPAPFDKNDTVFYAAGGEGMVLTKNCATPAEAAEFIFWIMKPENNAIFAYGNGMLPANYEGLNYEPFKSDPDWDIIRAYLDMAKVFTTPFNPNYIEFRDTVLGPTLVEVAAGTMTFEEANALIEEQAKAILNR